VTDARKPAHCPDGHDEKFWVHLVGQPCDPATHEDLDRAWHAAHTWLDGVVDASFSSTLGQVHLPSSMGVPLGVDASAVDPSQAYLLLARARRGDEPTVAIYIGLVGQTVTGPWRGLTGFYLPYCGECQELDERVAEILDWMPQEAVALDPQRLPEALRPRDGWFDDRMLLGIKPNGDGTGEADSSWRAWRPDMVADATAAALVCCGPMMRGLANVVFTDSPLTDLPDILSVVAEQLNDPTAEPVVSVRLGSRELLLATAGGLRSHPDGEGVVDVTVRGRVSRTKIPADWGVYALQDTDGGEPGAPQISRSLDGTARMIRATGRLGVPGSAMTVHYWPSKPGVVAWDHLLQLRGRVAH
jgi:hypothetical protein